MEKDTLFLFVKRKVSIYREFIGHLPLYNKGTRLRETNETHDTKGITTMMNFDELSYNSYSDSYMYDYYDAFGDNNYYEEDDEINGCLAHDRKPLKVK